MHGTRISIAKTFAVLLVAGSSWAAGPDYFPLQVGNSWVYRATQGRVTAPATVDVQAVETFGGRQYFRVKFFNQEKLYLRANEQDGTLLSYDPETSQESVWLAANGAEGSTTETTMDDCSKVAKIDSRAAKVKAELGQFDNALRITYVPNCSDAGITEQFFLPYVGLIVHETTSFAGPVRHELVYSRTGITALESKTNAFTLGLDAKEYKAGEDARLLARVTLRATEPLILTFPSGQSSDMRIFNDKGENVYTWSADKLFTMIYRGEERVGPGERSYVMEAPLGNLAPGKYSVEAWLTTQPKVYSATVSFEVVR